MDKCEICQMTSAKWAKGEASIADLLEDNVAEHVRICRVCFRFLFSQLEMITHGAIKIAASGTLCEQYRKILFGIARGKEPVEEKTRNLARLHMLLCEQCGEYFFNECGKDETIEVPPLPRKVLEAILETGTDVPEGETIH